jgi:hypothetical protein
VFQAATDEGKSPSGAWGMGPCCQPTPELDCHSPRASGRLPRRAPGAFGTGPLPAMRKPQTATHGERPSEGCAGVGSLPWQCRPPSAHRSPPSDQIAQHRDLVAKERRHLSVNATVACGRGLVLRQFGLPAWQACGVAAMRPSTFGPAIDPRTAERVGCEGLPAPGASHHRLSLSPFVCVRDASTGCVRSLPSPVGPLPPVRHPAQAADQASGSG